MAPGKSYALLFAFLAGRCALGADDDVDGDAVKAYFDLNAYPDDHQDLHCGMYESLIIPCQNDNIGNLHDVGDDVAMSTAASSTGRHIERIEHTAVLTGTSDDETMHDPASHAIDHKLSGVSTWAPSDVDSSMLDFVRQTWVSCDHDQLTTFNFDAGAVGAHNT
ncbi:Uncharacterized protein PBTT_02789 [Plasmodiophora brassicae]|uniref:Uncharacterized protein n=1 Tax=Plasmodiophora brassicae TaxID=37360 RepID=A0A0G4IUL4_PLABS|nr:hypothetical protein PBRA_007079 [Plasmodiophora brassicae]SPQ95738.1 unnamed protein product [Plasmodiophora brassicae]